MKRSVFCNHSVLLLPDRILPSVTVVFSSGLLEVSSDADDVIVISRSGNDVLVNGQPPSNHPVSTEVVSVQITAISDAPNRIDIRDLISSAYPSLSSISIDAGDGDDELLSPARLNHWLITAPNQGQIESVDGTIALFQSIEIVTAGDEDDYFTFVNGATLNTLNAGDGTNTLDLADYSSDLDLVVSSIDVTGANGNVTGLIGFSNIDSLIGGAGVDHLTGPNASVEWNLAAQWTITGDSGSVTFSQWETLTGGSEVDSFVLIGDDIGSITAELEGGMGDDAFRFVGAAQLVGSIDGGAGFDLLDYGQYEIVVDVQFDPSGDSGTESFSFSGGGFRSIEMVNFDPPPVIVPPPPDLPPPPPDVPPPPVVVPPPPVVVPPPSVVVPPPIVSLPEPPVTSPPPTSPSVPPISAPNPEPVELVLVPPPIVRPLLVGAGVGTSPIVRLIDPTTGEVIQEFLAFESSFEGGVHVAQGDVTGDGIDEIIVAAAVGGGPRIRVLDSRTGAVIADFFAFEPDFRGGTSIAVADVDHDGFADLIVGAGPGSGPQVKVFDGRTLLESISFDAYESTFTGGVHVATADMNGDGFLEIITSPGVGGGPNVSIFAANGMPISSFFAYDPTFTGGVQIVTHTIDNQSIIITAPESAGGPHIRGFAGIAGTPAFQFMAGDAEDRTGVRMALSDVNGVSPVELLIGSPLGQLEDYVPWDLQTFSPLEFRLRGEQLGTGIFVG